MVALGGDGNSDFDIIGGLRCSVFLLAVMESLFLPFLLLLLMPMVVMSTPILFLFMVDVVASTSATKLFFFNECLGY